MIIENIPHWTKEDLVLEGADVMITNERGCAKMIEEDILHNATKSTAWLLMRIPPR
jgi:hypothetical protein